MTIDDIKPKVKKAVEESVDKGVKVITKAKEYLIDDTLNDIEKIFTIKKDKSGINLTGNIVCPECQGETQIRVKGNISKIVCVDCGILIKEYEGDE